MASRTNNTPLIVIVGETASGKSALAMKIAEQFDGEIICADSRTIYKGMDIGTAKPSAEDQARVPHHLLDVVRPNEPSTAADFKRLALAAIEDIASRGKIPLLVGGSGLYVDAVLYDFAFRAPANPRQREALQKFSVKELQAELLKNDIPLPKNARNQRHLIRALETGGEKPERGELRPNTLIIGLEIDRETLKENITHRVDQMFEFGFVDEVRALVAAHGIGAQALQAPGYKEILAYLDGVVSYDETKARVARAHLQLAKRQRTWFKRNKSIHWRKTDEVVDLVTTFLNK